MNKWIVSAAFIAFGSTNCLAQESTCPAPSATNQMVVDELVPSSEDAVRLAKLYEDFLETPAPRPGQPIRRSNMKTQISVMRSGYSWTIEINARQGNPSFWAKYIEMNICSVDGKVENLKIHM